ncbi:ATP-binding cassette domain-containing protein [Calidifontibacter sp. DB0510]|uniref:ATP-binding cassette domain-containing protein n=1 Tax=Metallococcus carri TaxID=1656884 RepID=A0A967E8S8_9MICO|nr:ATP-binding cassette domain-containing protein [Metallococcus carri]NHN54495.1 ATP-binding cassette domain-containing protein [Metallococcus carri]NOP36666.1 ATP-binding cassette domain-containing protein [Calidifontibacter sp. DB2511S]
MTTAIEADGLTKRYGRRTVVDHVSFDVPAGTVCGLVGPNGAGKTTVMSMLLGLVRPTEGHARLLGQPVGGRRANPVGALIEAPAFHAALSGRANLTQLAILGRHDRRAVEATLETVGLAERADDRYRTYSLGMKQRLGIAAALLADPAIVILDEPTNGVDPQGMRDIRGLIGRIAREDRTVLVSSHLLAELEHVCDHLVVLDHGGCRFAGPIGGLRGERTQLVARTTDATRLPELLDLARRLDPAADSDAATASVTIGADRPDEIAVRWQRESAAAGIPLAELSQRRATLEDSVLRLVTPKDAA